MGNKNGKSSSGGPEGDERYMAGRFPGCLEQWFPTGLASGPTIICYRRAALKSFNENMLQFEPDIK